MLSLVPNCLYGRLGAALSALIVVFSLIGLTMHKDFYAGKRRRDFFCFYTNLSNLVVLIYFALLSPRLYAESALRALIPHADFAVMMCIMLTFSVFHLLLFPAVRIAAKNAPRTRTYWIVVCDNVIIHYLVPWLVFFFWLLCSPGKTSLGAGDAIYWLTLPLTYAAWILLRAKSGRLIEETGSPYPYPFLDVRTLGAVRVARICTLLLAAGMLAGLSVIAIIRLYTIFFIR